MATIEYATEIRPFHLDVPEEELADIRRRIAVTQWPEGETVADGSQGVQLATMQELVRYWATEYDFRRFEARLNALPQFITEIDGLDIHFIHVRSPHENALPLIITHGWPGSVVEMLNVVGPLSDPTAHGGDAEDAFDVDVKGATVPAAVSVFPRELYQAARSWTEQAYPNLIYFNEVNKGNHFAAWQEPELFTTEVRAAFRPLRTNGGRHE
jgi:hypothetical protein